MPPIAPIRWIAAFALLLLLTAGTALAQDGQGPKLDWVEMAMGCLGGLALFLLGVSELAEGLKVAAGDRVKRLLHHATAGPIRGLATGIAATTILDSSSVTIILLIGLVDSGLLGFAQTCR